MMGVFSLFFVLALVDFSQEVKTCEQPPVPENGYLEPAECKLSKIPVNTICQFYCKKGYSLEGKPSKKCLSTMKWNKKDTPKCVKKDCPHDDRLKFKIGPLTNCGEYYNYATQGCEDAFMKKYCCNFCADFATGDPDCPFGDSPVCASRLRRYGANAICRSVGYRGSLNSINEKEKACCKTCPELASGDQNCPWGDNNNYYDRNTRKQMTCAKALKQGKKCGEKDMREQCCKTCEIYTGNPNCPNGDAASIRLYGGNNGMTTYTCKAALFTIGARMCRSDYIKKRCCKTCNENDGNKTKNNNMNNKTSG